MVWHLPVAGVVAGGVGVIASLKAISDGDSPGKAIQKGLVMTKDVALLVGTFGLISHDAGFDVSDSGICYDEDHSCSNKKI
ncbi:MAG: hypothetical protein ACK5QJ_07545 [Microcystis sp.]|jgi:hypothetical protein|uniref:hypothetical protein n=1 Tax=Microcystis sp. TaxID=1127 RepID=UPI0022C4D14E|nr:hypothetical protein [Microcystis sp. LE17-20D]MCZ8066267.1 hypothetical protein [Microcystis sp. LE17-20D]MCZ8160363.1 hypothetical protein [Microcystis sp. LE19-196.1B]MCZ8276378.1 hypothetical protein [Microcystis sp. LE19-4.1E]